MGTSRIAGAGPEIIARVARSGRDAALLGVLVLVAAMFGHLTRPIGVFASFWPANALLLGILVRNPRLATPWVWCGAFAGYIAADLLAGGSLFVTLWLTAANLAGVVVGFVLFQRLWEEDRRLRRPLSVLYLFVICAAAAAAGAIVGGGAAAVLFGRDLATGFSFWFISELVNNVIVLPVVLTAPRHPWGGKLSPPQLDRLKKAHIVTIAPLLALIASAVAEVAIGGPGTIAFPVPALLWCALSYSLFVTALLTLLVSAWEMIAVAAGIVPLSFSGDIVDATTSFRLGVALLALGPLTVASVSAAHNALVRSLDRAASYDSLTGALTRNAFLQRGRDLLERHVADGSPVAVLALDVDNFKSVNDRFGHAAGDQLLATLASAVSGLLRQGDLFGRIGGDEFAVVAPQSTRAEAVALAECIRGAIDASAVDLQGGERVHVTLSVGVVTSSQAPGASLESLLSIADEALYSAKALGRNRVVSA